MGRGPWATPDAVGHTFYFLGLQAVCPLLVLVKVGGGGTPVETKKASQFCLGAGLPSLLEPRFSEQGALDRRRAESMAPTPFLAPLTKAGGLAGPCGYSGDTAAGCTGKGSSRVPR